MNVLFVLPLYNPYEDIVKQSCISTPMVTYPNGLLSIAAYITKHYNNANIRILDFNLLITEMAESNRTELLTMTREDFWEYCLHLVPDFKPDIIGISIMFCSMYYDLAAFSEFLRKKYSNAFITAGGHIATGCYSDILQNAKSIDAICYGEGEIPFSSLVSESLNGDAKAYADTDNSWITRNKLSMGDNFIPENKYIYDLDEIPPYDIDKIVKWRLYSRFTNSATFTDDVGVKNIYLMLTTRGCPGRCVFCASQNIHGRKVRYHSAQRVKSDIVSYMEKYDIDAFDFFDDHFLADKQRALEILNFMLDGKITTRIGNPAFFSIDNDIAAMFKKVGITKVTLTVENGNEDTLKNIIHKPGNIAHAKRAVQALRDQGIMVVSHMLTGFPGETPETIKKGELGMLELGCNWYPCLVVAPLPGSELYEICKNEGYLIKDADPFRMDFRKCIIQTPDFTPEYIEKRVYESNLFLNFVNNYDMRVGNYDVALRLFEGVLTKALDTHAFALYYAAKCAKELKLDNKFQAYKKKYHEVIANDIFWKEWVDYFNIECI